MWRKRDGALCATMEVMSLHIDLAARKTAPWPEDIRRNLAALRERHSELSVPVQAGRIAGLRNGRRKRVIP